jgi:hypothetical protein
VDLVLSDEGQEVLEKYGFERAIRTETSGKEEE